MTRSMGYVLMCSLSLFACHIEHWEDCENDDSGDDLGGTDHSGSSGKAGGSARAGTGAGGSASGGATTGRGGSSGSGAAAGTGARPGEDAGAGGSGAPGPQPIACREERDCPSGYNCDLEAHQCEAATEETCAELVTEAACTHRIDCTPVYAGTNCSCGQDCTCHGGEPGCVCASFDFFVCRAVDPN